MPMPMPMPNPNPMPNPPSAPPPVPSIRLWASFGILAVVTSTVAFNLSVGLRGRWWSVGLEGRTDLPSSHAALGGHVTTSVTSASLCPCLHVGLLSTCGVFTAGALFAHGDDYPVVVSHQVTSPWLALGVRAGAELPLSRRLALLLFGEVLAPLLRTALEVDSTPVYSPPGITGDFGLALVGYLR
jgi:hypothetical protein